MDHYFSVYRVQKGDTLTSIAEEHGFSSPEALIRFPRNKSVVDPNMIRPDQFIFIPSKKVWLQREIERNRAVQREAQSTLAEYYSAKNNAVRAVFKAWDQITTVVGGADAVDDLRKFKNLKSQMGNLSNSALALAQHLQRQRLGGVALTVVQEILNSLGEIRKYLEKAKSALLVDDKNGFTRNMKIVLRMAGKFQSLIKLIPLKNVRDPSLVISASGKKTFDVAMLAFDMGLFAGEIMAACSPKADIGLVLLGFEEYDKEIGEELEAAMMGEIQRAQEQITQMTIQLASPVYTHAI